MRKVILLILLLALIGKSYSQSRINAGIGYFGENAIHPGVVIEFEAEKFLTGDFSLPFRADLGYFKNPDYRAMVLDIHKGFRKYLKSGFFFEQSLGIGITSSFYTVDGLFYDDDFGSVVRFRDGANPGFTPSVTAGLGYNLGHNSGRHSLLWVRPKVYWNFGVRSLNLPYAALQVGYTHNFKTKE